MKYDDTDADIARRDGARVADRRVIALDEDACGIVADVNGPCRGVGDDIVVVNRENTARGSRGGAGGDGARVRHGAVAEDNNSVAVVTDGDGPRRGVGDRVVRDRENGGAG